MPEYGSLNKAIMLGYLGADPIVRQTQLGKTVVSFSVATNEEYRDKSGAEVQNTEWHRVVIFHDIYCSVAEKYLHKGDKVYVEGKIKTRKWQDKDNKDHYITEIVIGPYEGKLILFSNVPEPKLDKINDDDDFPFEY